MLDPSHDVRSDKCTVTRRIARHRRRRPFRLGRLHEFQNLVSLLDRHHGTKVVRLIDTRSDLQTSKSRLELGREFVREGRVNVEPVGRRARRAAVAHLRHHRPLDGRVNIGSFQNQEGGIATEFHRRGQNPLGGLLQEQLADVGGTGEGQRRDARIGENGLGHRPGRGRGDHVDDTCGSAGSLENVGYPQSRQRSLLRGLENGRAPCRHRRSKFACGHRCGEVPGSDQVGDSHRAVVGDDGLVARRAVPEVTLNVGGLFGEPAEEFRRVGGLPHRVFPRFAILEGDQSGTVLDFRRHDLEGFAQDLGPEARGG